MEEGLAYLSRQSGKRQDMTSIEGECESDGRREEEEAKEKVINLSCQKFNACSRPTD